jgi:hypothetical protein
LIRINKELIRRERMKYLKYIGLLIAFFMMASCGGSGGGGGSGEAIKAAGAGDTSTVTIVIGDNRGAGVITESGTLYALIEKVLDLLGPSEALALIPDNVHRVIITIIGPNFSIRDDFIIGDPRPPQITRQYTVPNGVPLIFEAMTFDEGETTPNWQSAPDNPLSVTVNGPTTVIIDLFPFQEELLPLVFVSNQSSDNVSAIDPISFDVLTLACSSFATSTPCSAPRHLAVSFDGLRALVPFSQSNTGDGTGNVMRIDTNVPVFDAEIPLTDDGYNPEAVAFSCAPNSSEAWVVNAGNDTISILDAPGGTKIRDITNDDVENPPCLLNSPSAIAMAAGKAYVGNGGDSTVCVVDIQTRVVLSEIYFFDGSSLYVEASPDSAFVYLSVRGGDGPDFVYKIDTETDSIVNLTETVAHQLAVTPDGSKLYYGSGDSSVGVITTADMSFDDIDFSQWADSIVGVEVLRDGDPILGFASDAELSDVFVFNTENNTVVRESLNGPAVTIPVGTQPVSIASQPASVTNCELAPPEIQGCVEGHFTEGEDTDAPGLPDGRLVFGSGENLTTISGSLLNDDDPDNGADMYEIFIDKPSDFSASTVGSADFDTQLFLFSSDGTGVYANNDVSSDDNKSLLPAGQQFPSSTYFLVITSSANHPSSTEGFIFSPNSGTEVVGPIDPDRTIDRYSGGGNSSGDYSISIDGARCIAIED